MEDLGPELPTGVDRPCELPLLLLALVWLDPGIVAGTAAVVGLGPQDTQWTTQRPENHLPRRPNSGNWGNRRKTVMSGS